MIATEVKSDIPIEVSPWSGPFRSFLTTRNSEWGKRTRQILKTLDGINKKRAAIKQSPLKLIDFVERVQDTLDELLTFRTINNLTMPGVRPVIFKDIDPDLWEARFAGRPISAIVTDDLASTKISDDLDKVIVG